MGDAARSLPHGEHFEEAIARWELQVQTEVKKASSLPTAMFDAWDPVLEARLCAATETLFADLLDQKPPEMQSDLNPELHLEPVPASELAALPRRLGGAIPRPRLDEGTVSEYFAILGDACCHGDGPHKSAAAQQLHLDFHLAPGQDLEELAQTLVGTTRRMPGTSAVVADAQFAATCRRITAAVTAHLAAATGPR